MNKYFLGKSLFWKFIISVIIFQLPISSYSQVKESIYNIGNVDILYGIVYEQGNSNAIGHPFFLEEDIQKATLWFNGDKIDSVYVKYDLFNQSLILSQSININMYKFIIINPKSVDKFEIIDKNNNTYKFVPSSKFPGLPKEIAFYEEVYSNQIKYLIGRKKVIELVNDNKSMFRQVQKNFLIVNSQIYEVNSKKDIYNLFSNHKKEIKLYIRKNRIRIKKNSVKEITQVIVFYEKLLNKQ